MSKRIRVLYTIPNFNTAGSGKSVYDLVDRLDRSLFEPEICCFHSKGAFFKEVEALGVPIHIFQFTTPYRPWLTFLSRVWKISKFFKKGKYDIVHSWHWSSDISEPLAAKLAGVSYIYTKKAMGWGNRYWRWRSQLSTRVIAVNVDMMKEYFGSMLYKVEQFPLAIDTQRYSPRAKEVSLQQQLGLGAQDFVIISVANLVPVKGIETLLEAVKKLEDLRIKVLIVGNDTNAYGQEIKKKYNEAANIIFTGKQLDVRPYIALADLFVIPTKDEGRKEGIPNAPLEAMAMECPVLGSNISGINDILKPFPDSLFKADEVGELKNKIENLRALSIEERKVLAKDMRKRVEAYFSIQRFLDNHQSLYLEITKEK